MQIIFGNNMQLSVISRQLSRLRLRANSQWPKAKSAQAITEYVVIISAIIAGLIALQVYFSRASQGRYKSYTDNLGGKQFSARYSDYNYVRDTPLYEIEKTGKSSGETRQEFKTNQISRVVSADVMLGTIDADVFFSDLAPDELKDIFKDNQTQKYEKIGIDYQLGNVTSVTDNFSNKKLVEDKLF